MVSGPRLLPWSLIPGPFWRGGGTPVLSLVLSKVLSVFFPGRALTRKNLTFISWHHAFFNQIRANLHAFHQVHYCIVECPYGIGFCYFQKPIIWFLECHILPFNSWNEHFPRSQGLEFTEVAMSHYAHQHFTRIEWYTIHLCLAKEFSYFCGTCTQGISLNLCLISVECQKKYNLYLNHNGEEATRKKNKTDNIMIEKKFLVCKTLTMRWALKSALVNPCSSIIWLLTTTTRKHRTAAVFMLWMIFTAKTYFIHYLAFSHICLINH